ncbi:MAG: hypothetical protein ABIN67_18530 [Ferruginibacter sp.]
MVQINKKLAAYLNDFMSEVDMKTRTAAIYFLLVLPILTSCFRQAYFLSPFNATTNYYHGIPMSKDSVKSATYISGAVSVGGANEYFHDEVFSFNGYFHRSHNFNKLQAWYGANLSIGSYHLDSDSYYSNPNYTNPIYRGGTKFFGGLGVSGGMNVVMPMGTRHEWRVIGMESTLQNEYGSYLDFRKKLPDSAANAITRSKIFVTAGLTTEFVFRRRSGTTIGYKLAIGSSLQQTNRYYFDYSNYRGSINPMYISNTLQITRKSVTGFGQVNFGDYAANFQMGVTYRLGGRKTFN